MKPTKQTVYIPVNIKESTKPHISLGYGKVAEEQEGYFFTPEELNQYTHNVIKQSLETAAENAEINDYDEHEQYSPSLDKQSITNTFEETFNKFKHLINLRYE